MNLTTAIFLVNKEVRSVKVNYDPDASSINRQTVEDSLHFKSLDKDLKIGDLVIIPTKTRHGATVAKIIDIDFGVDFDSPTRYGWIIGKVDAKPYEELLKREDPVVRKVQAADTMKRRAELANSLNLSEVDFGDDPLVSLPSAKPGPAPAPPPPDASSSPYGGPVKP